MFSFALALGYQLSLCLFVFASAATLRFIVPVKKEQKISFLLFKNYL